MRGLAGVRVATRIRASAASAAVAGQLTLAGGSFLLQLLAARQLGAEGLGTFALLFGSTVMATAVSTGLVGDSLTVLDRHDPGVRRALLRCAVLVVALCSVGGAALAFFAGGLPGSTSTLFGLATAAFMAADLLRRTLMANLRFWSLVAVDLASLCASMSVLVACALLGRLGVGSFLGALATGQAVACVVALRSLPPAERHLPPRAPAAVGAVLAFGTWRAVQQFVRPTMLNLARWLVLVAAGRAAVGELEAARVFVAPAMLLVQGLGSYLFSSYAAGHAEPTASLLRRADRVAVLMLAGALGGSVVAALGADVLGSVVTGGGYGLSTVAVLGWGVYAASCAAVLPYGSLAAVRGAPGTVLGLRVADSCLGLAATAAALLLLGTTTGVTPWLLSIGSFVGGLLCRRLLVRRPLGAVRAARPATAAAGAQRGRP